MNKLCVILSLIIIVSTLGSYINPRQSDAQNPIFVEGWFCDDARNTVMHEVFQANRNAPPVTSIWLDCGAIEECNPIPVISSVYSRDADCLPRLSPPAQGTGANAYNPTPTINIGEPITFGVTSDQDFGDQCYSQINANSLQVTGRLRACSVTATQCGCQTKHVQTCSRSCTPAGTCSTVCNCDTVQTCGPSDWHAGTVNNCGETTGFNPYDNRQCYTNISCTAESSSGNFEAPIVTTSPACLTHVAYSIVIPETGAPPPPPPGPGPIPSCLPGTHPVNAANNTPANRDRVTEDTVGDDLLNAQRLRIEQPDSVIADIQRIASNPAEPVDPVTHAPLVGVDNVLQATFCSAPGPIRALFILFRGYCPEPTVWIDNSLNNLAAMTNQQANTFRYDGIQYPSQPQDCALNDLSGTGTNPPTDGNRKMRTFSSAMGGNNGFYSINLPVFDFEHLRTNISRNLYSNGIIFNGSRILPDVNARCLLYSQTTLPTDNGIVFCNDGTSPGANLAPTPVEAEHRAIACETSCPVGPNTCGGHQYWVFSDNAYGACQCETEAQTCH